MKQIDIPQMLEIHISFSNLIPPYGRIRFYHLFLIKSSLTMSGKKMFTGIPVDHPHIGYTTQSGKGSIF